MRRRCGSALAGLLAGLLLGAFPGAAHADAVDDFQGSWVDRALALQYELGADLPLVNAPLLGTHNSFNSTAEMGPTLSAQDSNQQIDLVSQLQIGIRSLELDLHRFPSATGGGFAPVVCHALENGVGCTVEKTLGPILAEIEAWLREAANSDQVILLYLEDDLQDEPTHERAAASIERRIGDLVFRPPAGGDCTEVDYALTRTQVREAGKQVVLVGNCGIGSGWRSLVHSWDEHAEERPFAYEDFPSCGPDFTRGDYESTLIRYFEDTTELTATAGNPDDGIPPATAAAMARCEVDLIGFDQLTPDDGRLRASVWSWTRSQPDGGRCALIRVGKRRPAGRWIDRGCRRIRRPAACLRDGEWLVPDERNTGGYRARRICERNDATHAVPRTGYQNQLLRLEMDRAGAKTAWLGYRRDKSGEWRASGPPS